MHTYRRRLRNRVIFSFMQGFVILLILLLLLSGVFPLPASRTIFYNKTAGHLLVQLVELPEPAEAELHTVAEWTLYGDGHLIFPDKAEQGFWQAHLSATAIWHLLDVIINQDHIFSNASPCTIMNGADDSMCLTVDTNGQQKDVLLNSVASSKGTPPLEMFLLTYHPMQATVYAPNPDHDGDVDAEGGKIAFP